MSLLLATYVAVACAYLRGGVLSGEAVLTSRHAGWHVYVHGIEGCVFYGAGDCFGYNNECVIDLSD